MPEPVVLQKMTYIKQNRQNLTVQSFDDTISVFVIPKAQNTERETY